MKANNLAKRIIWSAMLFVAFAAFSAYAGGTPETDEKTTAQGAEIKATDLPLLYGTMADYENATGKTINSFNESPVLAAKVASGDLPAVEERISDEPMVVKPMTEIGTYGGTIRGKSVRPAGDADLEFFRGQPLLRLTPDLTGIAPNIAKGWDFSADKKTLTLYLREGLKYSDGVPFTANDIMFWYEDIIKNDELTPTKPSALMVGGKLIKVEKISDYEVRFTSSLPYPPLLTWLAMQINILDTPQHFLEKWHIKYNPDAQKIAKDEGFDNWWQAFAKHRSPRLGSRKDPYYPTLNPYVLRKIDAANNRYFERNAYYWKIDVAGNQLPYIDEFVGVFVEDVEVLVMKEIAGEIDFSGTWHRLDNYTLYKKSEAEGGYRALLWQSPRNVYPIIFNQLHKDPVLREIFRDFRFRQAVSHSINRDELNETFFFGKAIPRQATVAPFSSLYEEEVAELYIEYDPEKSAQLLDEMGLQWDSDRKYRLRSDGEPITVVIEHLKRAARDAPVFKEYLEAIGIKVITKEMEGGLINSRRRANEHDLVWREKYEISELNMRSMHGGNFSFPSYDTHGAWFDWYYSDGAKGEEPPEEVKGLFSLVDEWLTYEPGSDEYIRVGREICRFTVENLYTITALGMEPYVIYFNAKLVNTPEQGMWDYPNRFWMPYVPEQWFFKE